MLRRLSFFLRKYFFQLKIVFQKFQSLLGFFIFLILTNQIVSGVMLNFTEIFEPMYILLTCEEELYDNYYIDDFLFLYESGVDLLVLFLYLYICRKFYEGIYNVEQVQVRAHGVFLYLLIYIVIFLDLLLSCTLLSKITLTIVLQNFHTFFIFKNTVYWLISTDRLSNDDSLLRIIYLYYFLSFYILYLGVYYCIDMHYGWRNGLEFEGLDEKLC